MSAEFILALFFIAWVAGKWYGNWSYYRDEEKKRKLEHERYEQYKKDHPNDYGGSIIAFPLSHNTKEEDDKVK